ncbi:unnamed protein product [Tuber aestivum]|uniref:Uncharacterized protein n=1 Tax=Tuber aestivum TaxID=59557 RepID=A0A292PV26_9PEZI|nr:unnamed protein product [Tuber aestivum]
MRKKGLSNPARRQRGPNTSQPQTSCTVLYGNLSDPLPCHLLRLLPSQFVTSLCSEAIRPFCVGNSSLQPSSKLISGSFPAGPCTSTVVIDNRKSTKRPEPLKTLRYRPSSNSPNSGSASAVLNGTRAPS